MLTRKSASPEAEPAEVEAWFTGTEIRSSASYLASAGSPAATTARLPGPPQRRRRAFRTVRCQGSTEQL